MTDPFETGLLTHDLHDRLLQDIDAVAKQAGIMKHWITKPLAETVQPGIVDWVTKFKFHQQDNRAGLCMVAHPSMAPVETQMYAICGCLTRNFIFAQIMTMQEIVQVMDKQETPDATCLLVPNLYPGKGSIPSWKAALMLDCLMSRHAAGKLTVLHVPDPTVLEAEYGKMFYDFVAEQFDKVELL